MSRLSLSDSDKSARDWFVETTRSLGCQVSVDAMVRTSTSGQPLFSSVDLTAALITG